ncbi:ESCRT-II complex, vps25 subunit [Tricholoma matsutake]|nr:ESCRT-II complex, vps25 subunit [Tricholoma matsutake 945]
MPSTCTTPSGFLLPSIHSAPPFFTQQPNQATQSILTDQWIHLILAYARHRKLFILSVEDAETTGNDWDEVLRNERINRKLLPTHLSHILSNMVEQNVAAYEPPKQTRSVLLYWRLPEEWAETLHNWATSTGQLNTILTFYDITDPQVESQLSGIPISLLRKAISVLSNTGRAQLIEIADGEGVRIFAGRR